jgi:hypothetical protein
MVRCACRDCADLLDRFGKTHWDFKTEEYGMGVDPDKIDTAWQACRGSEFLPIPVSLSLTRQSDCRLDITKTRTTRTR